jgi:serine phosphatase RsbU (regulator of sigma subunit)
MTLSRNSAMGPDERIHFLEPVASAEGLERRAVGAGGLIIGRKEPADLVLADSEVSRAHCRLDLLGEELLVADLGSTNGTFIDGKRITAPVVLPVGATLQVGRSAFKHEWRTEREMNEAASLDRDLEKANSYVQALLPPALSEGPIRTEWMLKPSAKLGGDAFGYRDLNERLFAVYLMDVSGHGAGAAMHSVTVMNLLRQGALPGTDFANPSAVLGALNDMFQMERHAEMYFTLWYGVFDRETREMRYASAGHHPAYLVDAGKGEPTPLRTPAGVIGAVPGKAYASNVTTVPPGSSLYVFSDGVFEIVTNDGIQWGLKDFLSLVLKPGAAGTECERLWAEVAAVAKPGPLDDDFTILVVTFD